MNIIEKAKYDLYMIKYNALFQSGVKKGLIHPFEQDLYDRLSRVYFCGIPLSISLKYLKPTSVPGKCYDRSLFITMGFTDAILVRGDQKDLALRYGQADAGHGWVEHDGWVYDPSSLLKIRKDLYYEMFSPNNVFYYKPEEYACSEMYKDITKITIDDLRPKGSKRLELCTTIPLIQGIADMSNNGDFINELNNHLNSIGYDYIQITDELNKCLNINTKRA